MYVALLVKLLGFQPALEVHVRREVKAEDVQIPV